MFLRMLLLSVAFAGMGCRSIDAVTVQRTDVASRGEAIAVVQASSLGFNLFFNFLPVVRSDLDIVLNRLLVAEAKAMGGAKVEITDAFTTPQRGVFRVLTPMPVGVVNVVPFPNLVSFPVSTVTGVVVR